MAGGVQTCQLTNIPLCGRDIMAIVVRQSVYHRDQWMPMCIPSYGRGNDDFMALFPPKPSDVQDAFAQVHRLDNMEALLEQAFVLGNMLPANLVEKRLRNLPIGLIYVDMEMWNNLRSKIIASLRPSMDWIAPKNAGEKWAMEFMAAVETRKIRELRDARVFAKFDMPPCFKPLEKETWSFDDLRKTWGQVSQYSCVSNWLSSWSEHQRLFSLQSYFPLAVKYAMEALEAERDGPALNNLIEFFNGVETLMLLNHAFHELREDWQPKSIIQEYCISSLRNEVARLVRRAYKAGV